MLRDQPSDFQVRDLRDPAGMGGRDWWAARCRHCLTWLTKYDHTAEAAERYAVGAQHDCRSREHDALQLSISASELPS